MARLSKTGSPLLFKRSFQPFSAILRWGLWADGVRVTMPEGIEAGGNIAVLRERFEIDASKPLPELDTPNAKAYETKDRRGPNKLIYALICRADLPVRIGAMRALKSIQTPALLQLLDWGIVEWPLAQRKLIAVIYDQPTGGRVLSPGAHKFDHIPEPVFIKKILQPIHNAISEMSLSGVSHRAIRLDNLYWYDKAKERIVLGDCVTSPPGYDNPPAYEPVEFAMCLPEARGTGTVKEDMYAFGITCIGLLNGRDYFSRITHEEVIIGKLMHSTYANYAGEGRVPMNFLEVLRGLTCDDIRDRWGPDSLEMWLNGRRLTPIQPKPDRRSQRPFKFEGKEYTSTRELSHALATHWEASLEPILDGKIEIWLRRGLEINELADAVALAIRMSQAVQIEARQVNDLTIARVLMLLDPHAPIRYRDTCIHPGGFGNALATAMMQKKPLRPYAEMIGRELVKYWVEAQGYHTAELAHYESTFKEQSSNLGTTMVGWGIERCAYEMSDSLHCLSPIVGAEYVSEIRELLPALDRVSLNVDTSTSPVDRHIAAYIAVKWQRDTKVQLRTMAEPDEYRATLGTVSLLAVLQWRLGPPALHGLCGWIGGQLGPIISSYHNRVRRKDLEEKIPELVRKGSLPELYNVLDDQEERQKDAEGFAWARAEYSSAEQKIRAYEQGNLVRDERGYARGQQMGALLSAAIALFTVTTFVFLKLI